MVQKEIKETKITKKAWIVIALLFLLTVISNADKAIIGFASVPIIEGVRIDSRTMGHCR